MSATGDRGVCVSGWVDTSLLFKIREEGVGGTPLPLGGGGGLVLGNPKIRSIYFSPGLGPEPKRPESTVCVCVCGGACVYFDRCVCVIEKVLAECERGCKKRGLAYLDVQFGGAVPLFGIWSIIWGGGGSGEETSPEKHPTIKDKAVRWTEAQQQPLQHGWKVGHRHQSITGIRDWMPYEQLKTLSGKV